MARKGSGSGITVDGLGELARDLKEFAPDLRKELRKTNLSVAKRELPRVQAAASALGSTPAHAEAGLKAAAGYDWAGFRLDAQAHPEILGAEFGGQHRMTTKQFELWRGAGADAGYFVFPTIRADAEEIESEYMDGINAVLRKTGWRL